MERSRKDKRIDARGKSDGDGKEKGILEPRKHDASKASEKICR
jgi:hypothetical protein